MKSLKLFVLIFLLQHFNAAAQKKNEFHFNLKQTEKNLIQISDLLYANKFECSNFDYRVFLNDLLAQGKISDYKKCEVDSTQWRQPTTYNEPYVQHYHRHPAYNDYPVVNISQQAAKEYCRWLTEKYNTDKKRKFKKVNFKLPTEAEWILAANNGDNSKPQRFPVAGGMFLQNSKAADLANYWRLDQGDFYRDSISKKIIYSDSSGFDVPNEFYNGSLFYLSHVGTFFPTKIGMYDIAGNAAEMLEENGRTKGGSWNSVGGYLRINGPDEYKGFTHGIPQIGFRVFMQVIEK